MRTTEGVVSRGVLLFSGGSSPQRDETDHEPIFRQESTFQYLFGVRDPDCFGTVELATGKATVYIPRIPAECAIWIGKVMPFEHFQVKAAIFVGVGVVTYFQQTLSSEYSLETV